MNRLNQVLLRTILVWLVPALGSAQTTAPTVPNVEQGGGSYTVQCPKATLWHPGTTATGGTGAAVNQTPASAEAPYTGPHVRTVTKNPTGAYTYSPALTFVDNGGAIRCQEISGGDGYMTEADGNQTFMFAFGPLSGLSDIENGFVHNGINGGSEFADTFDHPYCDPNRPNYNSGQPNPYFVNGACAAGTDPNGAVGFPALTNGATVDATISIAADPAAIMNTGVMNGNLPAPLFVMQEDDEFFLNVSNVGMIMRPDLFEQHTVHWHGYPNASSFYDGVPEATWAINIGATSTYYYLAPDAGTYFWHCHITPPEHLQMGMVGWLYVEPRQNRVPAGTDLYQAKAAPAGTSVTYGGDTTAGLPPVGTTTGLSQQSDLRTACDPAMPTTADPRGPDILCSAPNPASDNGVKQGRYTTDDPFGRYKAGDNFKYVYNDGDGSTRYDIDVPLQIHGFDPNFHFVGMTFNPEGFSDMKDKYFLLNGRSYPDTIGLPAGGPAETTGANLFNLANWTGGVASNPNNDPLPSNAISTEGSDGQQRPSQPAPALIILSTSAGPPGTCGTTPAGAPVSPCGQRAALRIDDLDVLEYQTLASTGMPMILVGFNAKILRDEAGNNLFIKGNSITLGGGESLDVIIDSTGVPPGTYFLYTPMLDHLSNDAENFGGLMTEVVVVP
jgi:hypothetical protein